MDIAKCILWTNGTVVATKQVKCKTSAISSGENLSGKQGGGAQMGKYTAALIRSSAPPNLGLP